MTAAVTAARRTALAAELRALYGYALIGPRVPVADRQLVRACIVAHTAVRDATAATLADSGAQPVAPQADYPDLYPVGDAATALDRAVDLEQVCAAAWRLLYARLADSASTDSASTDSASTDSASTDRPTAAVAAERATAQRALSDCAVRATRWRRRAGDASPTVSFPGIT